MTLRERMTSWRELARRGALAAAVVLLSVVIIGSLHAQPSSGGGTAKNTSAVSSSTTKPAATAPATRPVSPETWDDPLLENEAAILVPAGPTPERLRSAVRGGLDWLVANQVNEGPDAGSWRGGNYPTAVTSLAGLAILSHGHLPGEGKYGQAVEHAMEYVRPSMTPDGYLGSRGDSMYVHAICTLFGLSYLGQCKDASREPELAEWCRKAVNVIVEAQTVRKAGVEQGGWRYSPSTAESDLSVTSWQMLTLIAARQCGYEVDRKVIDDGLRFINRAMMEIDKDAVGYVYRPGVSKEAELGVTGTAIAIKTRLERERDPNLARATAFLGRFPPGWGGPQYKGFFYSVSFYLVQGHFQLGASSWDRFGPAMSKVLVENQAGDGQWPFPPRNEFESRATSPAYATAMSLLMLGMNNQYLPVYQRQGELFGEAR